MWLHSFLTWSNPLNLLSPLSLTYSSTLSFHFTGGRSTTPTAATFLLWLSGILSVWSRHLRILHLNLLIAPHSILSPLLDIHTWFVIHTFITFTIHSPSPSTPIYHQSLLTQTCQYVWGKEKLDINDYLVLRQSYSIWYSSLYNKRLKKEVRKFSFPNRQKARGINIFLDESVQAKSIESSSE